MPPSMPVAAIIYGSRVCLVAVFAASLCFISCAEVVAAAGGGAASAAAAAKLIDATESSDVYHLDLLLQRGEHSGAEASAAAAPTPPWFDGFGEGAMATAGAVAVVTVGHPIRRMLIHLRQEGVRLDEAMSWAERGGALQHLYSMYHTVYSTREYNWILDYGVVDVVVVSDETKQKQSPPSANQPGGPALCKWFMITIYLCSTAVID